MEGIPQYRTFPIMTKSCPMRIKNRPSKGCWRCRRSVKNRNGDFTCPSPVVKRRFYKKRVDDI